MLGGEPEGIRRAPGESGWRTNSVKMAMTTMAGKSKTRYKGTLILLLPRTRILRLRNETRGEIFSLTSRSEVFCSDFSVGRFSAVGMRFWRPLTISMLCAQEEPSRGSSRSTVSRWKPRGSSSRDEGGGDLCGDAAAAGDGWACVGVLLRASNRTT